ncbi:hypothetical protein O181_023930 [Austropuccinia psidii MF-1]|uniref:Uncharacterized protein n=1 Tax=Austropuccinia psidii MF-1 TaxID=1389203 RepID=A0A9Q3CK13_9BASI|nr:hypothetical protein [Austropuccinia psidii MF-1]
MWCWVVQNKYIPRITKTLAFSDSQKKKQIHHQGLIRLSWQHQPRVPISIFVTQSLSQWLKWFLSLCIVEEFLDQWAHELEAEDSNFICDVAQGTVCKKLFPLKGAGSELCLRFSMFIDWFNPLKNKLAGKQSSIGLITLNCHNLPPCLQYQTKYTCLAGLIPSPNQPTMITINNVLILLVNELYILNRGMIIPKSKYPRGRKITVKLATLAGDIVAVHKAAVFKSH